MDLQTLIASSAAFRTLVGAASAEEAKAHIYLSGIPASAAVSARPFALAFQWYERVFGVDTSSNTSGGTLCFHLEAAIPSEHLGETAAKWEDAETWYTDLLGTILDEMIIASLEGGKLFVREGRLLAGPHRPMPEETSDDGDFFWSRWEIRWGAAR